MIDVCRLVFVYLPVLLSLKSHLYLLKHGVYFFRSRGDKNQSVNKDKVREVVGGNREAT